MRRSLNFCLLILFLFASGLSRTAYGQDKPELFRDLSYSIQQRVDDLVSRMTLAEKVLQMQNDAPGIPPSWHSCI
jgi:beta-glucosidase